jgi:hypothetical protein
MTSKEFYDEIIRITEQNLKAVSEQVISLTEHQKNWRKDSESWSINEIFSHLNEYASYYHDAIRKRIEKTRFREPKETFISSPLGRSAWKSMRLGNARNIKRKFKSPKGANPRLHPELVSETAGENFLSRQNELLKIIQDSRSINIRKAKVAVSLSKFIRLRIGDAFLFVIYHNERHVQQILNIIAHPKFPNS